MEDYMFYSNNRNNWPHYDSMPYSCNPHVSNFMLPDTELPDGNMPAMPITPDLLENMNLFPGIPGFPFPQMPIMPEMPGMPLAPETPQTPMMPQTPEMPMMPGMPMMPEQLTCEQLMDLMMRMNCNGMNNTQQNNMSNNFQYRSNMRNNMGRR